MNYFFKTVMLVAAVVGLGIPAVAVAQKSAGGVVGEARMHPGTWGNQRSSQSYTRSQPMYRSTAPVIVRTEQAPTSVAQSPTERRSYSYEPSQQAMSAPCGCASHVATESTPANVQRSTETRRSYSYEPSMSESTSRSYPAPRMRSSRSSNLPRYLGTKDERNNYRNK